MLPRTVFRLCVGLALELCLVAPLSAQTLIWERNPATDDPEANAIGYVVNIGTESRVYSTAIDVGNVDRFPLSAVQAPTVRYLAVTAYNAARRYSEPSNELNYLAESPAPPPPPPQAPPCTSATMPVVTVESYTNRINLGQVGRISFTVSSPAKRRILATYVEWGSERFGVVSGDDLAWLGGLLYRPTTRGSQILTTYAVDETGCMGRTSRTRSVQVR